MWNKKTKLKLVTALFILFLTAQSFSPKGIHRHSNFLFFLNNHR